MKLPIQRYFEKSSKLSKQQKSLGRVIYVLGFLFVWSGISELVGWTNLLGEPEFEPFLAYWMMGIGLALLIIPDLFVWLGSRPREVDDTVD